MPRPDSKYLEIATALKREILQGKYEDRERFPSEVTLAKTALSSLLQRIRESSLAPRSILLDATLVVRASTGAK